VCYGNSGATLKDQFWKRLCLNIATYHWSERKKE